MCSGLVIYILGRIFSIRKNLDFTNKKIENTIQKACIIFRNNLSKNLYCEDIASELNIGYSLFRREFKKYMGMSPAQYHLFLRLQQAKYLLTNSDLPLKDISVGLGFCSIYHFSKLFKDKTGQTPGNYKKLVHLQALPVQNEIVVKSISLTEI